MCPQFANLLQHQTALTGTLLHDTCWTQKYKKFSLHYCIYEEQRDTHSPLPGFGSGVVCPGLFQEKLAKAGYSKHSNTKPV